MKTTIDLVSRRCGACKTEHKIKKSNEYYKIQKLYFYNEDTLESYDNLIEVCPDCGYTSLNIEEEVNPSILISDQYLYAGVEAKTEFDALLKKAIYIAEREDRFKELAYLLLIEAWYQKDNKYITKGFFDEANEQTKELIELLKKSNDEETYPLILDLYRIGKDQEKEKKEYELLKNNTSNDEIKNILDVINYLTINKDDIRLSFDDLEEIKKELNGEDNTDSILRIELEKFLITEMGVSGLDIIGTKEKILDDEYFGVIRLKKSKLFNELDKICTIENEDGKFVFIYDLAFKEIRVLNMKKKEDDKYYVAEVKDEDDLKECLEMCSLDLANKLGRILTYD